MKPQAWRLAIHRVRGEHQVPPWVYPTAHALGTYSSAEGLCTASIARLVDATGQSKATVCRQLQWLLEHGWIQVAPRVHPSGRRIASARILTDPRTAEPVENREGTVSRVTQGTVSPVGQTDCLISETAELGSKEVLGARRAVESLAQALADQKRIPR